MTYLTSIRVNILGRIIAKIAARRSQRDQLQASIEDLSKRGAQNETRSGAPYP